mmetsp:Transcript_24353/g.53179  ORF Transcript_24353/g.53179 Transcript_24353/m.53179 type:complete len:376 (-) Transcript_24353:984-2111(-)
MEPRLAPGAALAVKVVGEATAVVDPSGRVGASDTRGQTLLGHWRVLEVLRLAQPFRQLRLGGVVAVGVLVGHVPVVDAAVAVDEREVLVGHVGLLAVAEAVGAGRVGGVVGGAEVVNGGAVVVAHGGELGAGLVEDGLGPVLGRVFDHAAQLGDQVARDAVGEQLLARLVRDWRVESARLALVVVLVDAHPRDVEVHPLPLASGQVEVVGRGEAGAHVRGVHALAHERDVEGEEERHLRDEDRAELAVEVEHQLVLGEAHHELLVHVVGDAFRLPLHTVGDVPLGRVVVVRARPGDAKAPGLARRRERGGAVAALRRVIAAEADVLVGRVHGLRVGAPVPRVLGRKVLEEVELWRPELAAEEGVVVLHEELIRSL